MRNIKISLIILILSFFLYSEEHSFKDAEIAYKKGDYNIALNIYKSLEKKRYKNFEIFYNLGNCYYKLNNIGKSVLYYEKARLIKPDDPDLLYNISILDVKKIDKDRINEAGYLEKIIKKTGIFFSVNFLTILSFILLFFLALSFLLLYFKLIIPRQIIMLIFIILIVLFTISFSLTIFRIYRLYHDVNCVVMVAEALVRTGPSETFPISFKIHEGTVGEIRTERDGWYRIVLKNGFSGWINENQAEKIKI